MSDDSDEEGTSLSLTSFLFGNINKDGELADTDTFEADTVSKLKGLDQLLQGTSGIQEIIQEVKSEAKAPEDDTTADDVDKKAEDAEDFSNIDEAISDDSEEEETEPNQKNGGKEESPSADDKQLMPPPQQLLPRPPSQPKQAPSYVAPLANMLPEKYKGKNVKDFYPEFRENAVLQFSKLFPIKDSHKPRTWKSLKKRRIKREEKGGDDDLPPIKRSRGWNLNIAPPPEDPEAYAVDDAVLFRQPMQLTKPVPQSPPKEEDLSKKGPKPTDWRWGPAQYWYDMVELPPDIDDYDYGLKSVQDLLKDEAKSAAKKEEDLGRGKKSDPVGSSKADTGSTKEEPSAAPTKIEYPTDAFHMVTQVAWEDDIIWNGEEIRNKVLSKLNSKASAAGWVPSSINRTAVSFSQQRPGVKPELQIRLATLGKKLPERDDDTWYSIFPVENEELVYGRWEDEVIWDSDNMPKKLKPSIVSLDPNDENIIIAIPDDIDPDTLPNEEPARKIKIIQKHVKKSKLLLNRAGIISVVEEESPPPPPKNDDRDPFYIGNDEFYQAKEPASLIKVATGGTLLQHATPSVQLTAPFIPTHMGPIKLRQFHRWPLKRYSHGPLSHYLAFHGVQSLYKHQRKMEKWRTEEREEAGGGDIFLMRQPKDLSGKDGDIILMEYIEEFPPLMGFVGMSSKIKNYYKRKPENDKGPKELKYGDLTYAHTSPFLGTMTPGQTIQAIENNMYRAPIYPHQLPKTDFLIIRTRNEFSIREVNAFFSTGQECPLYEVPGPNSKRANNFIRDFLQVFIYRLFWKSRDNPKRIKMDDIKKAFPAHSESSIRKRLKPCAEFHRTGPDSNWWVMKPGFRLPTEEEIREMVDPEQCCAFYSMISSEQRLKDAGYGEKFILAQEDDENDNIEVKMDDEIKCAPWNTSRAYVQAMKGKCLLQLTGPADPTGPAKEGFSYVKIPNKPTNKEEQEAQPKRTVTGTDADLRKLPLKDAKAILRKNGVPEEEIKKLSRWEVIDVVRTLSTEKVKAGEEGADSFKFSRGNRFSIAEHQERYREDCQRIFEVQNKVLASEEVLSSDEDVTSSEEEEEEEDLDEMGKNIENMLSNKKTNKQFLTEREEAERRKLQKVMMENRIEDKHKKKKDEELDGVEDSSNPAFNQVLRITRTFKDANGKEYTRTELVRKALVIETYTKVRDTKDEAFIKQFATADDQVKEDMKKEKRRLQEQLRRIKRNQEREKHGVQKAPIRKKEKIKPDLKLKCGACGQTGHMKTNKACPKFTGAGMEGYPMLGNEYDQVDRKPDESVLNLLQSDDLVTSEGTKIKISEKVLRHAEEQRKKELQLKIPKEILKANKRKRAGTGKHCDYLDKRAYGPVKRRRTDPVISFSSFLETLLGEIRNMPESQAFLYPVSLKTVPDYLDKVKFPMDLQTCRENVQNRKYHSRGEFLADINQICENSAAYNGENSIITINSKLVLDLVILRFRENDEYLMRLEKQINPLLDDDDLTALTYILSEIMEKNIKIMQESWPFMKPVNKKAVKDYYEVIKQPMDLETMTLKIKTRKYHSREAFMKDLELIYTNSRTFNGETNEFTIKAKKVLDATYTYINQFQDHCSHLESKIRDTQQRAMDQAEMDSLGTSLGGDEYTSGEKKKKKGFPGKLEDDLEYSSDDEDEWDDVDDSQPGPSGFSVSLDPNAAHTGLPGNIVVKSDPGLLQDDVMVKSEPVDMEAYYGGTNIQTAGPVFNIQTGQDGTFYAEQSNAALAQPLNLLQAGGMNLNLPGFPGYQMEVQPGLEIPQDQQVDENYDPTDFLQGLGGVGGGIQGLQPGADMSDVVVPRAQNGDQNLHNDLAVSDDSDIGESDDSKLNTSQEDMMAF